MVSRGGSRCAIKNRSCGAPVLFFFVRGQLLGTNTPVTLRASVVLTVISVPSGISISPPLMKAPPAKPMGPNTMYPKVEAPAAMEIFFLSYFSPISSIETGNNVESMVSTFLRSRLM